MHTVNGGTCRIQYVNNNRIDKDTVKLTAVHVAISHTKETCMVTNEGERGRERGREGGKEGGREGEREREREREK